MNRIILIFFCFTLPTWTIAQPKENEERFLSAIGWLNSKLNYTYYDEGSEKFWKNTFYINEKKGITIKQISSKVQQTANIKNKNYHIRTFNIDDINPYTITVKEIDESMGRISKGKLLEIRSFSGEKNFHKTINGRKATSTSFLHLAFPSSVSDSLEMHVNLVKEKLYEAIIHATMIHPSDFESNKKIIFKTLTGTFVTKESEVMTWKGKKVFSNVIEIDTDEGLKFFGFDASKNLFYINRINKEGNANIDYYEIEEGNTGLILKNTTNTDNKIYFDTSNAFRIDKTTYFRQ